MNILIIVGSARKRGYSFEIANKLNKYILENSGSEDKPTINIFNIAEKKISQCFGCVRCCEDKDKYCILEDDIREAYKLMEEADSIVFISPIYESFISGILKNFFDRTNHYTSFFKLAGKPINLILSGVQPLKGKTKEFSNKHVLKNISQYFKNYSIITHTSYKFLGFVQHEDHHSINFEEDVKQMNKMASIILKQKIDKKKIKNSQYSYSV